MQWPSEPSAWNETAQKAGWKAKGLNPVTKHQIRAFLTDRSIYNLRWSKIHLNAKDVLMANWDVHTIGSIAAGLKGWAGLNRIEAKHVIYCIIESIQDDTREWILQFLFFFFVKPNKSLSVMQLYFYA